MQSSPCYWYGPTGGREHRFGVVPFGHWLFDIVKNGYGGQCGRPTHNLLENNMSKLQAIPTGEQATLRTTVEGKVAHLVFSIKENGENGAPRYNLEQTLDFTGVSEAELIELASKPLRIDVQSIWRKAKDRMDSDIWQGRAWNVREMLDQTRQKADPTAKVLKAAEKMSETERNALMDLLKAM